MSDFVTTDRDLFYRLGEARLAVLGAAVGAADAVSAPDITPLLEGINDLSDGLDELRLLPPGTDDVSAEIIVSYLLTRYALDSIAPLPFLPLPFNQSGTAIAWQDVDGFDERVLELISQHAPPPGEYVYPASTPPVAVALSGNRTLGRYPNNSSVVVANKTMLAVLRDIAAEELFPSYAAPTAALASSLAGPVEVGTTFAPTLTPGFTQNDAGALTSYVLLRGSSTIASSTVAPITYPPFTDSYVLPLGTTTYTATFSYGQGPEKQSNQGNPAPGRIVAGSISGLFSVTAIYRLFFGPAATSPTTRAQALALGGTALVNGGGTFTLNTGTGALAQEILLPPGRTLLSVVDLDALNLDITSEYVASGTVGLADNGAGSVTYIRRRRTQGTAYPVNHRHFFTLA